MAAAALSHARPGRPNRTRILRETPKASRNRSDLFDLTVFQFDRPRPPEDRHLDLEARALLVDLLDDARPARDRPVRHPDVLADLEADRGLGPIDAFLHLLQDRHGLALRSRLRLVVRAKEARDLRGVLDEVERL